MITITFTPEEIEIIRKNALFAELGGHSCVRMDRGDRISYLSEDQMTAQLGEAALSKHLTGSIDLYIETRKERNEHPEKGDGGTDLLGFRVDVKTSRMRAGENYNYHLWIRSYEYHPKTMYYLCLIPVERDDTAYLAGRSLGEYLPFDPHPRDRARLGTTMDKLLEP